MNQIENILKILSNKIGLDAESIGLRTIEIAINSAAKNAGFSKQSDYFSELSRNEKLLSDLIEEIKVPETWFFRDTESFKFIRNYFQEYKAKNIGRKLRILSIPCSTGEEPYSVLFLLLDAGFGKYDFSIFACDISKQNIEYAIRAKYTKSSFRNEFINFTNKYFININDNFYLKEDYKNIIKFKQANLVDTDFLEYESEFDIIYCKNLLIYFNDESKMKAIENLKRLLKNDGILISGHSELSFYARNGFERIDKPGAFALKKKSERIDIKANSIIEAKHTHKTFRKFPKIDDRKESSNNHRTVEIINKTEVFDFELAKNLANQGRFEEAENYCLLNIQKHQDNFELFYILGLINSSKNNINQAIEFYNKAIYLNPNHYESLFNLSLLFESINQNAKSEIFRKRAIRSFKNE